MVAQLAPVTDYASLLEAVPSDYGDRSDIAQRMDRFINRTEALINNHLRVSDMTSTATLTSTGGKLTPPAGFRRLRSIRNALSDQALIDIVDIATLEEWLSQSNQFDQVCRAAVVNDEIMLARAPEDGASFVIYYYGAVPALTSSNTTNWLIEDHPDVYLFGCLMQAALYDHDDGALANYQAMFTTALNGVQTANNMDRWGDDLAMQPSGVPA